MLEAFEIDLDHLPVLTVGYASAPTAEALVALFDLYADIARRGAPMAYIIDFRKFDPVRVPASIRKVAADCFNKHGDLYRKVTICEARVVTSTISRGTLTAFDWLTGTKWPCANFATLTEARVWVYKRLDQSGALHSDIPPATPATSGMRVLPPDDSTRGR